MELSINELEGRGAKGEGLELRRWRLAQRLPSGRRMRLGDFARLVGCSVDTVSMYERGVRVPSQHMRARMWSIVLSTGAERLPMRPLAKTGPAVVEAANGQLALPLVG
jgi:hypothetical protein